MCCLPIFNPANILVVDDDLNNLRLLAEVLTRRGYEARPVRDGKAALAAVKAKTPDLILLDIMMPYINGYEVCLQLKADAQTRNIPIIFLSALYETVDKVKAFSTGGNDYITKPFQADEVIARIENQLQICRLQKELQEQNQQLQKTERELRLLLEATQAVSKSADVDSALAKTLSLICQAIGWDFAEAWLPQEDGEALALSCGNYSSDDSFDTLRQRSETITFALNQGLPGRIWSSGQPEWIEDISHVENVLFLRTQIALEAGLKSVFGVPVVADDRVLVVLVFFKRSPSVEDRRLLDLVSAVAVMIGSLIGKKQAEMALRRSEERLHLALEGSNLALWDWHLPTGKVYRDRAWKEMLGYQDKEIEDNLTAFNKLVHPEDAPKVTASVNDYLQGKIKVYEVEFRMRSQAGEWKWIRCRGKISQRDRLGQPVRITGTHRDISERKHAALELQMANARLQQLLAASPAIIFSFRVADRQATFTSENIRYILGYEAQNFLSDKTFWAARVHPEDLQKCLTKISQLLTAGFVTNEYRFLHADGTYRWIYEQLRLVKDSEGNPLECVGYWVDISDRKHAEEEMQAAKERLELVWQASQDGFWDWDFRTGEIYFSPRFKEMLGYEDSEFPNQLSAWEKVIFDEDRIAALQLVEDYNSGFIPQFLATQRFHHKNGSTAYILSRAIHLKNETGEVVRMLGAHTDITNLKQAEAALQKAVIAADAANRAKSEFLANMSHELRTPLNAIIGFAQIMARHPALDNQQKEYVSIINRAGEHLLDLINDILEMSKIEAGKTALNSSSFNLVKMLNGLRDMLCLRAQTKNLQLQFSLAPHLPQSICADESKLRQVLINMLGNAIKFTQQGSITLRAWVQDCRLEIDESQPLELWFEIEDTGSGIAEEEIHLLFKPFGQTAAGRQSQQGTGLGLPISRKFVELMGGDIQVSSTLGQGSIFTFNIQAEMGEKLENSSHESLPKIIGLTPNQPECRILIAEDNLESRLLLIEMLNPLGFQVKAVSNGTEAIATWSSWHPHLICMDMRMPVTSGYEAAAYIKTHQKTEQSTIIIALTASAFEEERHSILAAGCDDFIRKPFREYTLLEKIRQHLNISYILAADPIPSDRASMPIEPQDLASYLEQMPANWLQEMHQAACACSDDIVLDLINQIPEDLAPLADALANLTNDFQFQIIMELTQPGDS